jgi:mono/diheme cytochrome c family protein
MKTKKILISITFTGFLFLLLVSFVKAPKNDYVTVQQKKWVAPESADKIVNPLKGDANAAASGKKLYKVMCFVCHGPKGKGDGMAGAGLTPKPADLTSATFQSQSDGAIFWKIEQGRSPMPSYKTSIPEKKRWEIINYLRTLK